MKSSMSGRWCVDCSILADVQVMALPVVLTYLACIFDRGFLVEWLLPYIRRSVRDVVCISIPIRRLNPCMLYIMDLNLNINLYVGMSMHIYMIGVICTNHSAAYICITSLVTEQPRHDVI